MSRLGSQLRPAVGPTEPRFRVCEVRTIKALCRAVETEETSWVRGAQPTSQHTGLSSSIGATVVFRATRIWGFILV